MKSLLKLIKLTKLNRQYDQKDVIEFFFGLLLIFITVKDSGLKYLLWSCDLVSMLLSLNLMLFKSLKIYFFVFLVSYSSTIEWILDYFKMKLGFEAPKTEWMLETDEPLIYTELQHAAIMLIPLLYIFKYLKSLKNSSLKEKIKILSLFFILVSLYYLILILISYYLTLINFYDISENINCVIKDCGIDSGFRDFKGLIYYWLHYLRNLAFLFIVVILLLIFPKNKRFRF